jgi:hypothetical protein
MGMQIECDSGWTCRGTEEVLVAVCSEHGLQVHGMESSRAQILAAARPIDCIAGTR